MESPEMFGLLYSCLVICSFAGMWLLKKIFVVGWLGFLPLIVMGQKDSLPAYDTSSVKKIVQQPLKADSAIMQPSTIDSLQSSDTTLLKDSLALLGFSQLDSAKHPYQKIFENPFLPMQSAANDWVIDFRQPPTGKEELFYLIAGILLFLALFRVAFPKYLNNLFTYFFQTSFRQKQTRDQLLQDQISSLLMNLLFFMITATFITLAVEYYQWVTAPFWKIWMGSVLFLMVVYFGKYLFLQFAGWVFNTREAAGIYVFIVFMMNKMMGILLMPLLLLVAFSSKPIAEASFNLGWGLILLVFVYRYLVSFSIIRNKIALHAFHFFIYLLSVEIIPLLLIYKLLMKNLASFL
jgi:hypothetical protein